MLPIYTGRMLLDTDQGAFSGAKQNFPGYARGGVDMRSSDVNLVVVVAISLAVAFMLWFLVNLVREGRRRGGQALTSERKDSGIWE